MIKYVALYRTPDDPETFDKDYFGTHVPIVNDTPGLVRTELAKVTRMMVGEPAYYLLAELYFDSVESMKAAFKTEPWRASGDNLQSWGGMDLVTMFTAEVVDDSGMPV
ncbi:MAG TPA: EthD family reductase [Frankiaceae bacterium]|nr:EthD family reductase [Frankiaceae bacterium]